MSNQKVALVTGGARRIGRAIVEALAAEGYAVVIHANASRVEADALAAAINAAGGRAAAVAADLALPEPAAALMGEAAKPFGPVTLLVNNASLFLADTLQTIDVPVWNRQFSVNIRAPSVLAGAMASALPPDSHGAIINIIDQRVWKLTPEFYSYTLSKAALWAATRTMAQALAPRIRVNAVGPGPTLGNIHDGDAGVKHEAAGVPLLRQVDPQEIAAAVLYLAGAESVTGQMIAVDAGQHIGWKTPDILG
ncbi:MAG: SDR family oxidoreductase [Methylocystis sp.]|nr:SDR family oxidoreductase [Methylocystis sp.]MCA3586520.1 SDR family oxidoreductase [Methylocystis sp.]MCA3592128.1 SDR family oxidoreductase [Methylocystis sp.]